MAADVCAQHAWHWSQTLHPLCGNGYQFWSGIEGPIEHAVSIVALVLIAFAGYVRIHNCHIHGCPFLAWHVDDEHGHPVCRRHHPHHPKGGGGHHLLRLR